MLNATFVAAATVAKAIVSVWLIGIAVSLLAVRRDRRDTSDTQRHAKTWRWRLKLALAWPYWVGGIILWEARGSFRRRK